MNCEHEWKIDSIIYMRIGIFHCAICNVKTISWNDGKIFIVNYDDKMFKHNWNKPNAAVFNCLTCKITGIYVYQNKKTIPLFPLSCDEYIMKSIL